MIRWSIMCVAILFCLNPCLSVSAAAAEKTIVFVSIAPQKCFADAIGGDLIQTTVVVSPAHSPADYEPAPSQMVQMARADIYFAVGVPFENAWLEKFAAVNPGMRIVHTDAGIEKKPIDRHDVMHPSDLRHEGDSRHAHGMLDPHVWLSPPLVKIQAKNMLNALVAYDPDHQKVYQENYRHFIDRVEALDRDLRAMLSQIPAPGQFLVFHPSWGYFADAYGLTQIPIEIEGKSPKAREVMKLVEFARARNIRLILVQPQFSNRQADIIAREINGRLIPADPLAQDWFTNLRTVAASIEQATDERHAE